MERARWLRDCALWRSSGPRTNKTQSGASMSATITGPLCDFDKVEEMSTDACQFFYTCPPKQLSQ